MAGKKKSSKAPRKTELVYMIHGMWCNSAVWEGYRAYFESAGYTCILPTLRHHDIEPGAAPPHELGTTSLLDYLYDLEKEISELPEKPIIIGHSMGGLLAQMLAERDLCRGAVLLMPASPYGIFGLVPSVTWGFLSHMLSWRFWAKPFKLSYSSFSFLMFNRMSPAQRDKIFSQLIYESGRAAAEIGLWGLDRKQASWVDERKVKVPMLVVGARHDRITPVKVVRKVAQKYKETATYVEYPDRAHWVFGEEGWEEIARMACDWIEAEVL